MSEPLIDTIENVLIVNYELLDKKINEIAEQIKNENNRSLLAVVDILEPAKPMKSNNWNSIRASCLCSEDGNHSTPNTSESRATRQDRSQSVQ